MARTLLVALVVVASTAALSLARPGIQLIPLGNLPGGGAFSVANGISADGTTVAGHGIDEFGQYRAFRWTESEGPISLGGYPSPEMSRNFATAVSADGSVIAVQNVALGQQIFHSESGLWTASDGLRVLGRFPGGMGEGGNIPDAISGDGRVIAGLADTPAGGARAFRWSEADGWEELGLIPGAIDDSRAHGVNYDGSVIVGESRSPNTTSVEAFRWTRDGGMVGLGDLPGGIYKSKAFAVSADGSVIVGSSRSGDYDEPFRWTAATGMVGLGFVFGRQVPAAATAVSADGEIVVGYATGPWVWDEQNGMRSLVDILQNEGGYDLSQWGLGRATGVAHLPDGRIVVCGWGDNATQTEGWVAVIPSPSALMLVVMAAGAALNRSRAGQPAGGTVRMAG